MFAVSRGQTLGADEDINVRRRLREKTRSLPGRTGTHHDEMVNTRRVDRHVEPQALGDLGIRRVLEHALSAADHHGNIANAHMKRVEERPYVVVYLDVDITVGVAVARE